MPQCRTCKFIITAPDDSSRACAGNPPQAIMAAVPNAMGVAQPRVITFRPEVRDDDKACHLWELNNGQQ